MKIKKLKINNFKGLKSLEIELGNRTIISGCNGTGKTSILDAYLWLLTGKNSENQKEFGVKPYNNGEEVHNIDVIVEAYFEEFSLMKILKEKWGKKRGSDEKEFLGNETECYIDNIQVSVSKYNEFITSNFGDENIIKAMSLAGFIFGVVHWKQLRELVLKLLDGEKIMYELKEKMGFERDCDMNIYKEQTRREINEIKSELSEYPIRISELKNQILEVEEENVLLKQLEIIDNKIITENNLIEKKKIQIEKKLEEKKLKFERISKLKNDKLSLEREKNKIINDEEHKKLLINELLKKKQSIKNVIDSNKEEIEKIEKEIDSLRLEYQTIMTNIYKSSDDEYLCYNCGQPLPKQKIEEIKNSEIEKFNENKRKSLENITHKAEIRKNQIKEIFDAIKKYENQIQNIEEEIKKIENSFSEINKDEFDGKIAKLDELINDEEKKLSQSTETEETIIDDSILKKLYEEKQVIILELEKIKRNNEINQRIVQLEQQWKKTGSELTTLERIYTSIERYEIELSRIIEGKANNLDRDLQFKLFKKLINGSFEPCCEVMYDGVLYNDLNYSRKIIQSIKMIELLGNYLNYSSLPVWVDNAEAINELPVVNRQLIALYVSNDEKLKIEKL